MWNRKHSVTLSIVVCLAVAVALTVALFIGPWAIRNWFIIVRGWSDAGPQLQQLLLVFKTAFYPCAVFGYIALYSLMRLLFNIRKEDIFITRNVTYLRCISWCCFAVALITLVVGVLHFNPFTIPFLMVAVAAGFVGLMLRVVKNVMQAAVEIREENELTI